MFRKLKKDIAEAGGEEHMFDRIARGETLSSIADSFGVSVNMLYMWRDRCEDPEGRKARWAEAMRARATYHEEKALSVLEEAQPDTAAEARIATHLSDKHEWLARAYDKEKYSDKQQEAEVQVELNFGDAFLASLRAHGARAEAVEEAQYELLPDGA